MTRHSGIVPQIWAHFGALWRIGRGFNESFL
jgi:hypothetical protein